MTLRTDFVNNIGMEVDADYLNGLGAAVNANTDAIDNVTPVLRAATVATSRNVNSPSSYTDATDTTDQVTVKVGASGVVLVRVSFVWTYVSGSGGHPMVGVALSGANTLAASDAKAIQGDVVAPTSGTEAAAWLIFDGLTPGDTTFKLKYKSGTDVFAFSNRKLLAIPFA